MENRAAKKAKKGILSVIFGRTALILALILVQLYFMLTVATILHEYAVYVYGISTVIGAGVIVYIINERGNPAFNMTWVLLILIFLDTLFQMLTYLHSPFIISKNSIYYIFLYYPTNLILSYFFSIVYDFFSYCYEFDLKIIFLGIYFNIYYLI